MIEMPELSNKGFKEATIKMAQPIITNTLEKNENKDSIKKWQIQRTKWQTLETKNTIIKIYSVDKLDRRIEITEEKNQ